MDGEAMQSYVELRILVLSEVACVELKIHIFSLCGLGEVI